MLKISNIVLKSHFSCLLRTSQRALFEYSSKSYCDDLNFKYDVPHYDKVNAWDKQNKSLKILGKILSSKRDRAESDSVVLEGVRLIKDAISHGLSPSVIVFSREKLLWQLELGNKTSSKLYHIPYNNIKMWTDLSTSPGIMAAFSKQEIVNKAVAQSPVPLSLICDNVRTPDNLGAVIRVAAAAGARQILCTRGCVDAWSPKVVRAAAGAHFLLPIVEKLDWSSIHTMVDQYPKVLLADLDHDQSSGKNVYYQELDELDKVCDEDGEEMCYMNEEICDKYKRIPLSTINYGDLTSLPGYKEAVVVVGGETEGVSGAAHMFCHRNLGQRLHVPLRNNVNSLNVISATSLVMFRVREALENTKL